MRRPIRPHSYNAMQYVVQASQTTNNVYNVTHTSIDATHAPAQRQINAQLNATVKQTWHT